MKVRVVLTVFVFFLVMIMAPYAFAETISTQNRQEIRQEKRIEVKEGIDSKRLEIRQRLSAIKRERIRNYFGKMVVRIEATIERLEKLTARIETRIKTIKEKNEGVNTIGIEKEVSKAKTEIGNAKADLASLKLNFESMLSSDEPRQEIENVRESLKNIKEHLKEVHNLLVQVIGDIKGLRIGDLNNEK